MVIRINYLDKINDLKPLIMIEGINKVYHMNFLDNTLPDKCANLIIADITEVAKVTKMT